MSKTGGIKTQKRKLSVKNSNEDLNNIMQSSNLESNRVDTVKQEQAKRTLKKFAHI